MHVDSVFDVGVNQDEHDCHAKDLIFEWDWVSSRKV